MNETNEQQPVRCPGCTCIADATDSFCRRCGRSLKPGLGFMHSHTGIILLTLVLGPFALPLVWTSKRIGTVAKWIYTVILVLTGIYLIKACWAIYQLTTQAAGALLGGGF